MHSIYKAQLAAIYSRHIWLTITLTTHCSLGADKPRYHRRSLATFSTIGSHRWRMPISLSCSFFAKPTNPMEVTPSEFDRHPWGVCRWFKTLGACNVSPIEQVRLHKGSISRVYIYIYIRPVSSDFLRGARASKPANRAPPWRKIGEWWWTRFELLPRVDVCMNHWPIFIAIFTGSRLIPPIIYRKTGGKPVDLSFNYSSNGQLLLLRISFLLSLIYCNWIFFLRIDS